MKEFQDIPGNIEKLSINQSKQANKQEKSPPPPPTIKKYQTDFHKTTERRSDVLLIQLILLCTLYSQKWYSDLKKNESVLSDYAMNLTLSLLSVNVILL